jgi:hypothetical protein
MRTVTLAALGLVLAGCGPSRPVAPSAASDPPAMASGFPSVVAHVAPDDPAPGREGAAEFTNTYEHAVSLATQLQPDSRPCAAAAAGYGTRLEPGGVAEAAVTPGQKLCFSVGVDLARPLVSGICEARSGERISLAAYGGCYRR